MKPANVALALAVIAAGLPLSVSAETLHPAAPIVAVTVFQGQAEITRKLEFQASPGRHALVLDNLPGNLIANSLRLEMTGTGLALGAINLKRQFNAEVAREAERRLRAELQGLSERVREQDDLIKARRLRLDFIAALIREIPKGLSVEGAGEKLMESDWRETWTTLGAGTEEALREIRIAEGSKRELNKQIALVKNRLQQLGQGRAEYLRANISFSAEAAQKAVVLLRYQIPGASWQPVYDLRLDSASESARLELSAMVHQRTGEDWPGVELTLSTTRPGQGGALPSLGTWFVDVYVPRPVAARGKLGLRMSADKLEMARAPKARFEDERLAESDVRIVASDFAAVYKVPSLASLRSGGEQHRIALVEKKIETQLSVRAVPKLQPFAYLYGEVTYKGEEPLLPGAVALYRDGTYVGRTSLPLLRPGQKIDLSFGIDDRVRVTRRLQTGGRSKAGLFNNKKRHERRYLITVANHHTRAIQITVQDNLPTPRDERIEVEMLKETTPATETDVEKRKGVLAWSYRYAPGEERTIHFGFALIHPETMQVPGF